MKKNLQSIIHPCKIFAPLFLKKPLAKWSKGFVSSTPDADKTPVASVLRNLHAGRGAFSTPCRDNTSIKSLAQQVKIQKQFTAGESAEHLYERMIPPETGFGICSIFGI
jgi:hypothetical protein